MAVPEMMAVSGANAHGSRNNSTTNQGVNLERYSQEDLLDLRSRIDELMPTRGLKDFNLETELVLQLQAVQRLQNDVMADDETPANQRAQVAGQVASALAVLAKLQTEVYTSERLKVIEAVLVEVLNTLPLEQQNAFLSEYGRRLGA